ncbi:MAG: nucleotidyltransferase [Armatimonadota bacterium]|nr:MAG: nucleotidyltransferase [Armatimonadota bacterium]
MNEEILQRAKRIITEEVEKAGYRVVKVVLFGSRARGEARADSDWDFLVVVDRDLEFSQKEDLASDICWRLATQGIYADVFVLSSAVVQEQRDNTGYLVYYALKEGAEV